MVEERVVKEYAKKAEHEAIMRAAGADIDRLIAFR